MTDGSAQLVSIVALTISALALLISAGTAWLTLIRRGTIKMTQPTVFFFGPDGRSPSGPAAPPKIFLRALLFSTSKRGRIVENMYVNLSCDEYYQEFNVWAYGATNELVRGSGVFVGDTGVEANHHFLIPRNAGSFRFRSGQYRVDVYAQLLGDRKKKLLFSQALEIASDAAKALENADSGLYFDWAPDLSRYVSHIHKGPHSFWEELN